MDGEFMSVAEMKLPVTKMGYKVADVQLDADGNVTEGRGWNIFAINEGWIVSPDSGVLEGITGQTAITAY